MVGNYLFYIGNIGVPSMGFCILIGTIFAVLLCYWAKRFSNLDWNDEILDGIIWAVLGGFVGMKLLYWIVTPDIFLDVFRNFSWKALWDLSTSGMVFYGGLIGGVTISLRSPISSCRASASRTREGASAACWSAAATAWPKANPASADFAPMTARLP